MTPQISPVAPLPAPARGQDRTRAALAVAVLTAVATLLLVAFAWPATRSTLHDIPLGIAGPAPAAEEVGRRLSEQRPGVFEVHRYPDEAAARAGIRTREVYGAIVLAPDGAAVLTASAAGPAVAQGIAQLAPALQAGGTTTRVRVEDVVPAPVDDPRGAGLAAGALPLVLGGILAAVLLTAVVRGRRTRVMAAFAFAAVGGLSLGAVMQYWIGALEGPFAANAGVLALGIAAVSVSLLGLQAVLGHAGLAVGAAVMVALGNPLSGAGAAPAMLPDGWGTLGRLLPPGAEITALRSTAFFDRTDGTALAVLLGWIAAGLLLSLLPGARSPVSARPVAREPSYGATGAVAVS